MLQRFQEAGIHSRKGEVETSLPKQTPHFASLPGL